MIAAFALPVTSEEWTDATWHAAGLAAGWLVHPLCWLAYGPLRWLAFGLANASHESGWRRKAAGDGAESVGLQQFHVSSVEAGIISDANRSSPFWSGFAAGTFVQSAVLTDPMWVLRLFVPFIGWAWHRRLWTHGADAGRSSSWVEVIGDALGREDDGQFKRGLRSLVFFRGLSLVALAACMPRRAR